MSKNNIEFGFKNIRTPSNSLLTLLFLIYTSNKISKYRVMKIYVYKPLLTCIILIISLSSCQKVAPPAPIDPLPSADQIAWQEMEFYGFLHFNMNTFTNIEWGYGDKSPTVFNPTNLDTRQWARVAKEAGMKGLIITAKHHDGFCLWPSAYTEHSVKNSTWKDGKGDVLKELAEACKAEGIKMGVYLSPWDRNHADYGKPEYITYFRNQLTELLTNYGDIFEVWFDGANGGDGYYGGANEVRKVDKKNYYDWKNTFKIIEKLQPNALIFGDGGPGVRWVGNEHGDAYETTWSPLLKDSVYGGMVDYNTKYAMGQENGNYWVPAEADVSIRPGWYYHPSEDDKVKSLNHLLDIYYRSVGQNATLLLNFPIDTRGLIHENDVRQLKKLSHQLSLDFEHNIALSKKATASNTRGNSETYAPLNTVDSNTNTYWTTDDDIIKASITIDFRKELIFNRLLIQEYIALGQRVKAFSVSVEKDGSWVDIAKHSTIGYKRILRFDEVSSSKIRITIDDAKGPALLSNIEVYHAPPIVDEPEINRVKNGKVHFGMPDDRTEVYYTLDGTIPTMDSKKFVDSLLIDKATTVKAFAFDPINNRKSDVSTKQLEVSKANWKVIYPKNSKDITAIDDNKFTKFSTDAHHGPSITIDLGAIINIKGFTYTPDQSRWANGIITHYTFQGSKDGKNWKILSKGEFANIIANPIQQSTLLPSPVEVRYIKLIGDTTLPKENEASFAEIGIITK